MDFWRAVGIINRRKWLILVSVVVTAALTFGASRLAGAKWVANVRFATTNDSAVNKLVADHSEGGGSKDSAENQAIVYTNIIRSKEVLGPALKKAGVETLPEGLQAQSRYRGAERFSAALLRRGGGR